MSNEHFDRDVVAAAFAIAAEQGLGAVSVAAAARRAGARLDRARSRFPSATAIWIAFGRQADQTALAEPPAPQEDARTALFDMVMRRIDALQAHRDGVRALMRGLPRRPGLAVVLACATVGSMGWMLEAAGVSAQGWRGRLRAKGMALVWAETVRAWDRDDTADLSETMAALDRALDKAARYGAWLGGDGSRDDPTVAEVLPDDDGVLDGALTGLEPEGNDR